MPLTTSLASSKVLVASRLLMATLMQLSTGLGRRSAAGSGKGLHIFHSDHSVLDVAKGLVKVTTDRSGSGGAVLRIESNHSATSNTPSSITTLYDSTPTFSGNSNNLGNLTIYNAGQVSSTGATFEELRSFSTDARNTGFAK